MPNQDDRAAIDGLFDRIEDVARNSAPRDRDSEFQIQERLQGFPPAPYYMAQTILIQEQALREAQARIQQLESQDQQRGGRGFGGMFGADEPAPPQHRRGPWDRGSDYDERPRSGGGFLAGAAQTALGVTGGVLLGSALAGMLTGGANAGEFNAENGAGADPDANTEADAGADEFDAGGDDLGGGDFDMGGDF